MRLAWDVPVIDPSWLVNGEHITPPLYTQIDIARCLLVLPTVHDLRRALHAIADEFGGCVRVKNGFDMTDAEAAEMSNLVLPVPAC